MAKIRINPPKERSGSGKVTKVDLNKETREKTPSTDHTGPRKTEK